MNRIFTACLALIIFLSRISIANAQSQFPTDPNQIQERTSFQTSRPWSPLGNLRADVAMAYGIDTNLPSRIQSWRDHGYRIHVMTGVAWGEYQDYIYGRFDGVNHEDEEQTNRDGKPHSHGGDVFYMCPGANYGKFLCVGVQRALDAGAEAIHLEEPEFWVQDGYEEGFKREWQSYYHEAWQPPHSSVDAQWRASRLKYFLYRRALQQVFDYIQDYNQRTGRHVHCYVPTHSLLNYAQWSIVSPESSLARLNGCDGYIAQVWTGTSREPNLYRGQVRERTFETAFLEYGAMQNLVRATGRTVWYLNDPIEDNPQHDWNDYQRNWESTLTASLFQPEVSRFEIAPWPERIFGGVYPRRSPDAKPIPPAYATELQTVMNALNDMKQSRVEWDCGTTGIGVIVGDGLMFQRGEPTPSDPRLSQVYGLALPLLKRGLPVTPVQLENVTVPHYLDQYHVLLMTYHGMKPLSRDVHAPLADWVKHGGVLVFCDDDADPYNRVREWWNSDGAHYATPREELFEELGIDAARAPTTEPGAIVSAGQGGVLWLREDPAQIAANPQGDSIIEKAVHQAATHAKLKWRETNYLLLRRGPYVIAAGLDESIGGKTNVLHGRFVNLFDSGMRVEHTVNLKPGSRFFLLDLDAVGGRDLRLLASAGRALPIKSNSSSLTLALDGVGNTPSILLLRASGAPRSVSIGGQAVNSFEYSAKDRLLWVHSRNEATPREMTIEF